MMMERNNQPMITLTGPNNEKQQILSSQDNECEANCSSTENNESSSFVRSFYSPGALDSTLSPSKFSRLSLAIRRSLRLGTRYGGFHPSARKTLLQDKPVTQVAVARQPTQINVAPFTEFTDLRPEVFIEPQFGTLETLNKLIQNRHLRHLKKFLRDNDWPLTHEIRKELWRNLVSFGDKEFESSKLFYREQIDSLLKSKVQNFRPAFLSEPGIVVCDHGLKEIGVINLQRLLIILYPLCAVFLHYQPVDVAFACVNRLLAQGNRFVLQSELSVYASRYTLLAMLKKFKRKVYNKLSKRMAAEKDRLPEVMCLPLPYLVRLIDCFLFEGQKMLARAVLTVLYLWYKQDGSVNVVRSKGELKRPAAEDRVAELNSEISAIASKIPISIQTFMDIGFSIRRFSNGTMLRQQSNFENKHREVVSQMRAAKNSRQPDERIYTPAFLSNIVDEDAARELMAALPARFQLETPTILFRLSEHGTSFVQLWTRIEEADQSILIIRTTENHVFGAYCSSSWAERKDVRERAKTRYFGTGESFVWRLDEELKLPIFYTWSEQLCDNYFMAANDKFMIIGSGGGDAIAIRDELVEGSSRPSQTFQSPELVPGGQFQIDELEVWAIPSSR